MLPPQVIIDRFAAMYQVAKVIQSGWVWAIMSLSEMGSYLASVRASLDAAETANSDMLDARFLLDDELVAYRTNLRAFLRVGKLRYRNTPSKYKHLKPLVVAGSGRDSTIQAGRKVESAWKKTGQTFVPVPNVTYVATRDRGVLCVQLLDAYEAKLTERGEKAEALKEAISALDRANVEWYATATTVFPAGTRHGNLIRSMVPTNNRSVELVEQAIMDMGFSPEPGKAHLEFHAPNATSYYIWHKAIGSEEWVLLAENVDALSFDVSDLEAGAHQFRVAGKNSRGLGPVSVEITVQVSVAAAA